MSSEKPIAAAPCPGPRWARRKEARPGEIIAAALTVFAEYGYAAARIEDIAASAGVTKGTVYLYFKNKEELFAAVIRETLASTIVSSEELFKHYEGSTESLLREMANFVWSRITATGAGAIPKLVFAEAKKFPELARLYYHSVVEPSRELNRRIIERGIQRGEFRAVNADDYTSLLLAPALFQLLWRHTFEHAVPDAAMLAPERILSTYMDMVIRTLRKTPLAGES